MLIFKKQSDLRNWISRQGKVCIGFVPTMGALHRGHISLIEQSKRECELTVCSIFVNPTQFNDPADLVKYPRPIGYDIELLQQAGCDALYLPEYTDLYETNDLLQTDLGGLDTLWEGEQRPGHFLGMVTVVKKLFDAVQPTHVFFGQKDFQQCSVIRKMMRNFQMQMSFRMCDIIREDDGLAMSSRNIRLSAEERKTASNIYKTLSTATIKKETLSPEMLGQWATKELGNAGMVVEYAAIVDTTDLKPATTWEWPTVLLVAVKLPSVRLIDNILLS